MIPLSLPELPVVFAQAGGNGLLSQAPLIIGLFAIIYFVMIRPQQKQAKEAQDLLSSLKKGDDVITSGGIVGKIFSVDDKFIQLEVAAGVKLRVLKASVQARVTVEAPKSATTEPKKEEK